MAPSKSKTTIYDVASKAGVAISTVSRVLNNSTDVSEYTRSKVLDAINELQFRPHRTAKTLAQKHTAALAIAIPSFTTPFHNTILKGVRRRISDEDFDLLLFDLGSKDPQQKLLDYLRRGAVDGLLLALHIDEDIANELRSLHAPIVIVGNKLDGFDSFYWDNVAGAKEAVTHLVKQGHKRIGMISTRKKEDEVYSQRVKGYKAALKEAGIPYDPELVQSGITEKHAGISEESGFEAINNLLALEEQPTAIFAGSDAQAIGAIYGLKQQGLKVPENMAIVGYDDIKTSYYIGLSSVDQNILEIGYKATDTLIGRLRGELDPEPINLMTTPKLIVRASSLSSS